MKTYVFSAFIVLLISCSPASSQTTFQKTFGDTLFDAFFSIQQTADGGYVTLGTTASFGAGGNDVYLIKFDVLGDTLWTKTYGTTAEDYGSSVRQTADGGYIIAGSTSSTGISNTYLIKSDSVGNMLWSKTYGSGGFGLVGYGNSVRQTTDGGYILLGGSSTGPGGDADIWLLKLNTVGDTIWTKVIPDANWGGFGGRIYEIHQTTDKGYIISGTTDTVVSDMRLIKTDSLGNIMWTKYYGGVGAEAAYSVRQTSDGGYIITGYYDGALGIYLIKTNEMGEITDIYEAATPTGQEVRMYPNPTSDITTITFTLPETQNALLSMYDQLGKRISILFDGEAEKNRVYSLEFNGVDLSEGVYFYRLFTDISTTYYKLVLHFIN